jgi:hypothetical protein
MIPETTRSNTIALFEAIWMPCKWNNLKTLNIGGNKQSPNSAGEIFAYKGNPIFQLKTAQMFMTDG